ncbi:MAG TPA: DUF5916 domain-containing protein, partial [bacterium]|nr:DUF5916 domain-containing protein [bacterium]
MTFLNALFAVALLAADPVGAASPRPSASPPVTPDATPAESPTPTATASPAPTSHRDFSIPAIEEAPVMDGRLDESVWKRATRLEGFTDFQPIEDVPASQKTTVYIYRDSEHLYVGFDAEDTEPAKIRGTLGDRDSSGNDDFVGVMLDSFGTGRRGYLFGVNPTGVLLDCLESETGNDDCTWDGIFYAAAHVDGRGWTAEIAIPFATLRLDPDNDEWYVDPLRAITRKGELSAYSPLHQAAPNAFVQMPRMSGMKGLKVVPTWQLIPEVTARTGPGAGTGTALVDAGAPHGLSGGTSEGDVGVTARVSRGDLSADGTLNPDFSQVESDTSRVTINQRFPLSYDEKRPFFFEGREQFNLPWNVIYTRAIVDPIYGLKVEGKAGPTSFAILNAADAHPSDSTVDPTWNPAAYGGATAITTVGRATTEVNDAITMGFVGTEKHIGGAGNRVVGPDIQVHFAGTWTFVSQALWSATDNPDTSYEEGTAVKFRLFHSDRHWSWFQWYEQTDNGFRAEAGFIPRVGYRESGVETSYRFETGRQSGLLFVRPGLSARALNATNNDDQNRDFVPYVGINFGHSFIRPGGGYYIERFEHDLFEKKRVTLDAGSS